MRYVKYIGLAHRRMILADEWRSVGIDAETVSWDHTNAFMVPADKFTDEQLRKVIKPDTGFVVIGTDDEPEPLEHDMTPAQASTRIRFRELVQGNGNGEADEDAQDDGDVSADTDGADDVANAPTGRSGASTGSSRTPLRTTRRGSGKDV